MALKIFSLFATLLLHRTMPFHCMVMGCTLSLQDINQKPRNCNNASKDIATVWWPKQDFFNCGHKNHKKWPDLLFQGRPKSPWKPISQPSVVCHIWGHTTKVTFGQVWHDKSISICVHVCFLSFGASVLSMNLLYLKFVHSFWPISYADPLTTEFYRNILWFKRFYIHGCKIEPTKLGRYLDLTCEILLKYGREDGKGKWSWQDPHICIPENKTDI